MGRKKEREMLGREGVRRGEVIYTGGGDQLAAEGAEEDEPAV